MVAIETRVLPFLTRLEAMAPHRSRGLLKNFMKIVSKVLSKGACSLIELNFKVIHAGIEA